MKAWGREATDTTKNLKESIKEGSVDKEDEMGNNVR